MELKIQDKEEISWKQLNSKHKDKDGLKESELRQKLVGIMSTYDLLDHFEDTQDLAKVKPYRVSEVLFNSDAVFFYIYLFNFQKFHDSDTYPNKSIFKDKKLSKLWEKAEISGFTTAELNSLKQEFQHHQDKLDIYYSLLENLGTVKSDYHESKL